MNKIIANDAQGSVDFIFGTIATTFFLSKYLYNKNVRIRKDRKSVFFFNFGCDWKNIVCTEKLVQKFLCVFAANIYKWHLIDVK